MGLGVLGPLTSLGAGAVEGQLSSAFEKEVLQGAATAYLSRVFKLTEAAAIRITATVDLAGGWQAFVNRINTEIEKDAK